MQNQNEMQNKAQLAKKIVEITEKIGQMVPQGHNNHSHYDFVGYEQMNAKLRTLLPSVGLALVPEVIDINEITFQSAKGAVIVRTTIKGTIEVIDIETGYSIIKKFVGSDQDQAGKSCSQAVTEMLKRFELKLFHVSTKADIDPDSNSTTATAGYVPNQQGYNQQQQQGSYQQQQGQGDWM
jgi:hypothetical protein